MFRISLISLLLLMSVGRIYAQPEVEWQRFYGIDCPDEFNSHIRTEDDGWAFTGYRMPDIINFLYLVKTDPEGQLEFESTYGEGEAGWTGHDLSQTEDGGYLIGGNWDSNRGYGFGALRTDPNGNLMWQRTYGDFDRSLCYAVIGSSNNEFYLAGFARTEESGNQGYIVKISANGDIIWEQLYGGNGTEEFRDITATNIGYVLCGSSSSVGGDDKDFWFVRINSDGEELQSETYGNELDETAYAIKAYPNQAGWMLSGERGPGWPDFNAALLRINQEGNQQWLTEYEHDDLNTHAYDCVIGPDEGITAVGYGNGRNIHLAYCFGTDNAGNLEWGRMHNLDDGGAIFQSAVLDDDGGVTIAGTVDIREGRFVNDQGWFLKLAAADLPPRILLKTPADSIWRVPRGGWQTFSVTAIDPEGADLVYHWVTEGDTLDVDEDRVSLFYPELDTLDLTVYVSDNNWTVSTGWEIIVVPLISDWSPQDFELSVEVNDDINFQVEAGLPGDTSLTYLWRLGEDIVSEVESAFVVFQDTGLFDMTVNVRARDVEDSIAWEITVIAPDEIQEQVTFPIQFELFKPYPNPFNSTTKISYQLPTPGEVSIQIFDITGREVASLVNGTQLAGHHSTVWRAGTNVAGIYLIRIESAEFTSVRKVVLVK